MKNSNWFLIPKRKPYAKARLFCFPYAGGGTATYIPWDKALSDEIELVIVQMAGRGPRIKDALYRDMASLVGDLSDEILSLLDRPFVFFGHSLGSRVAFELMNSLSEQGFLPSHFIASGSVGPHLAPNRKHIYKLPKNLFIDELRKLNGTPIQLFDYPELIDFFLPVLRADFELAGTYRYSGSSCFPCPVSVFGGSEDRDIDGAGLYSWGHFFSCDIRVSMFDGDHFFVDTNKSQVLEHVNEIIEETFRAPVVI